MSTIGVTYHNEDIHNIIKEPTPPIIKSPMYKSKRPIKKSGSKSTNGKIISGHQTFGLAHYEAPKCSNFLRKKTKSKPSVVVGEYFV